MNADLALFLCARSWGVPSVGPSPHSAWQHLGPAGQERLRKISEGGETLGQAEALAILARSHRAQCRAEPGRVHSSWWVRALQEESPAVRRVVAGYGPLPVRAAAATAFGFRPGDLEGGPPPNPEVLEWVLALWAERLVGGEPPQPAEPPVIFALSSLSSRLLYRLCQTIGVARTTLAGDPETMLAGRPVWAAHQAWLQGWFLEQFGSAEPQLRTWASKDLAIARAEKGLGPRRGLAMRGLTSIARLLTEPEPFRVRWALQHVPYPIAKRIRSIMAMQTNLTPGHLQLESTLLRAAWERLVAQRSDMASHPAYASRKAEAGDVD
ncbi:MAG: hypothetical protein ACP5XB_05255 [Isosphaeraceae bacterium]